MPSYATPGVYIEEIAVFPPSVAAVATAIPAFIGLTEKHVDDQGADLKGKAVRLTSLLEFERYFGLPPIQAMSINVTKRLDRQGAYLDTVVGWDGAPPSVPAQYLPYAMQLYFANGGGPCYVFSLGAAAAPVADYTSAIKTLEAEDEPTLIVFPDAVALTGQEYGSIVDAALDSCNRMQDRFTVADVPNAVPGGTEDNADVTTNFRSNIQKTGVEFLKYGAAYFPYLRTLIPFRSTDAVVTLKVFESREQQADGTFGAVTDLGSSKTLDDAGLNLSSKETAVYAAIRAFLDRAAVTMPPSGAVVGAYAQTDRTRGVWKAPANVGLSRVSAPAVPVTNEMQGDLNIDPTSGKSVNAIRSFIGRGTLVWGGRTLAGNDGEWKYVNVRRFANFVEESVGKAIGSFVFEPNNANTWIKVRTMIESFLTLQWRDGALMGAKPEDAFRVAVGLGQTMTPQEVLDGVLKVDVHLAIVRPAEFVVLRFMQQLPQS